MIADALRLSLCFLSRGRSRLIASAAVLRLPRTQPKYWRLQIPFFRKQRDKRKAVYQSYYKYFEGLLICLKKGMKRKI